MPGIEQGEALLGRMNTLAAYHLADHPDEAGRIAGLTAARGHRKLASGLLSLAEVYARHPKVVASDPKNYRASDEGDARRISAAIFKALSDSSTDEAQLWTDRCARVWTLLSRAYAEVQFVGRFLLRATPDEAIARFPSLVAEGRAQRSVRKSTPDAPAPGPVVMSATQPAEAQPAPKRRHRRSR